jgi:hypothetical protein
LRIRIMTAEHPEKHHRLFVDMVYQPILELLG